MSRRILDLNARPVDHRNDPRLNAILKRADTGILILAAIERGDSLTDALNDGRLFSRHVYAECNRRSLLDWSQGTRLSHRFARPARQVA
jgi:hypothetical protein